MPLGVVLITVTSTVWSQASDPVAVPHDGVAGQSIVVLAGHVIDGAVMSRTVIVALQVEVLLQSSVALHTRVHTWGQDPVQFVLTIVIFTLWSTSSEAVGVPQVGVAGQSMVWLAGQVMVGGTTSVLS